MAAGIEPTSPLQQHAPLEGPLSLRELPWRGKINLRGDPGDAKFMQATADVLGVALPTVANTTATANTTDGETTLFWLGPDEWLAHCELARADAVLQQLRRDLAPFHHAATEVTDYYSVLELGGEAAADALARGCPLDLHERAFTPGQCAQTRFGNAAILLYKPGNMPRMPCFQIQVRWSFCNYVWDYLATVIASL